MTSLRRDLIGTLAQLGDPTMVAEARRRYAARPPTQRRCPRHWGAGSSPWSRCMPMVDPGAGGRRGQGREDAAGQGHAVFAVVDREGQGACAARTRTGADRRAGRDQQRGDGRDGGGAASGPGVDFAMAHRAQVETKVGCEFAQPILPSAGQQLAGPGDGRQDPRVCRSAPGGGRARPAETAIANIVYRGKVRSERLPAVDASLGEERRVRRRLLPFRCTGCPSPVKGEGCDRAHMQGRMRRRRPPQAGGSCAKMRTECDSPHPGFACRYVSFRR